MLFINYDNSSDVDNTIYSYLCLMGSISSRSSYDIVCLYHGTRELDVILGIQLQPTLLPVSAPPPHMIFKNGRDRGRSTRRPS